MYNFNALLNRLKYIPRWSLMRQSDSEDVAQHTTRVMLIAHTLAMISKQISNTTTGRSSPPTRALSSTLWRN